VPPNATAEIPSESDLAMARAAVSEVLIKGASSVPWENPKTGARGTVTPLASLYSQNGISCRDFLASFVKNGSESWLQGAACRAKRGTWEVRNLEQQLAVAAIPDYAETRTGTRRSRGCARSERPRNANRRADGTVNLMLLCGALVALPGSPHHIMGTIGALTGIKTATCLGETEDA
jgi:hypothetical protein